MRISGIGFLNSQGVIQVHKNIVEGLSIFDGSILFGVFYPRSKDDDDDVIKNDFTLTPIPYNLWPKSSRLIIKLLKQSGSLEILTKFLKDKNVSILHSVSNRSGHRYSTWDIHIAFDDLELRDMKFSKEHSYYDKVFERTKAIRNQIESDFSDLLFRDKDDIDHLSSVNARVNTGLHYFYSETEKRKEAISDESKKVIYSSFTLRYTDGNIVANTGRKLINILSMANKTLASRLVPTIVFIETDSHYLNFRVRIIDRERLNNFFKLSIYYERHGELSSSSKGLMNHVISAFSDKYKIWKFYNQLYECRGVYGCGRLNFIIEDTRGIENRSEYLKDIKYIMDESSKSMSKELDHVNFWSKATWIYPNYVRKHFKRQRENLKSHSYDVFISYYSGDIEEAESIKNKLSKLNLTSFLAPHEIDAGANFSEKIKQSLQNSRELCLVYSSKSKNRVWVNSEWGAAWFMGKHIVPVLVDIPEKQIRKDDRLSQFHYIKYRGNLIEKYALEVLQRRLKFYLENDDFEYYK